MWNIYVRAQGDITTVWNIYHCFISSTTQPEPPVANTFICSINASTSGIHSLSASSQALVDIDELKKCNAEVSNPIVLSNTLTTEIVSPALTFSDEYLVLNVEFVF